MCYHLCIESAKENNITVCDFGEYKEVVIGKLTYHIYNVYESRSATVVSCEKDATDVVIPVTIEDGVAVTKVGESAFENCDKLKTVLLPEYDFQRLDNDELMFEEIGAFAFAGCTSLEEITIPLETYFIGKGAFRCCTSLKKVTLESASLITLCPYVFAGCTSLVDVTPVATASEGLFDGCTSLTYLPISSSVQTIENRCFAHCTALEDVVIRMSVDTIEALAFRSCANLKKMTFEFPNKWRWTSIYSKSGVFDFTDPYENAEIFKTMDFDDGILRFVRTW